MLPAPRGFSYLLHLRAAQVLEALQPPMSDFAHEISKIRRRAEWVGNNLLLLHS
jgi:hypothetical protein